MPFWAFRFVPWLALAIPLCIVRVSEHVRCSELRRLVLHFR